MSRLTHLDGQGRASMVDVGGKDETKRIAKAAGKVSMRKETAQAIREGAIKKGDVLAVARVAGIQAAKRAWESIPLAHPIALSHVGVDLTVVEDGVEITCEASVTARTGVEMEAMCGVTGAALCVYDMAKAIDREMIIENVRLLEKSGGRSGSFKRSG